MAVNISGREASSTRASRATSAMCSLHMASSRHGSASRSPRPLSLRGGRHRRSEPGRPRGADRPRRLRNWYTRGSPTPAARTRPLGTGKFGEHIGRSARDREIVGAMTAMVHELDMMVVAEAIETDEQLDELGHLKGRRRGYLFARPLTPAAVAEYRSEYDRNRYCQARLWLAEEPPGREARRLARRAARALREACDQLFWSHLSIGVCSSFRSAFTLRTRVRSPSPAR